MASENKQRAGRNGGTHVFSTLFPAQSVDRELGSEEGINKAIQWCRETGVTKVYVETFRSAHYAQEENLTRARDRFREAGLEVSGCVTTTKLVTPPDFRKEWAYFPCFTYEPAQEQVQQIFESTARLFDEIMIDDFYCTFCECSLCRKAKGDRSWAEYRVDLMRRVSKERVLGPAHRVNPGARVIIKYPQWYEMFQSRGYDPDGETKLFDLIWVGTESRDIDDDWSGHCATYRPFWIMRWLGQIGGDKCGGGWYDPYHTHEDSYLEQARQTILGGARESLLFCYPALQKDLGPANIEAFRKERAGLLALADWVKGETPRGVVSYRPIAGRAPRGEQYIFDWLGMVGVPLIPAHEFPAGAQAAFFSSHSLHDDDFVARAKEFCSRGGRAILTPPAAEAAGLWETPGAYVLHPPENPRGLMDWSPEQLADLRRAALEPFGMGLKAPTGVSLYLLGDRKVALESFRREPAEIELSLSNASAYHIALALGRHGEPSLVAAGRTLRLTLPPRTLVTLET